MANVLLALGANLGDPCGTIAAAMEEIARFTTVTAQSSLYDTTPVGGPANQPRFMNAAATLQTTLAPHELLIRLQTLEHQLGRVRDERWGPRAIDLDLLLVDEQELNTADLTLPHPRLAFRRFVLDPAVEIAADWRYPLNGWTIAQLHANARSLPRRCVLDGEEASKLFAFAKQLPIFHEWEFYCDEPSDANLRVVATRSENAVREFDRLRRCPNSPPVLWLPTEPRERWENELQGALEAMSAPDCCKLVRAT